MFGLKWGVYIWFMASPGGGGWGGGCEKRGFPERVILIWCFYPGMIQCGRTDSVKGCSE